MHNTMLYLEGVDFVACLIIPIIGLVNTNPMITWISFPGRNFQEIYIQH